MQVKFQLVHKLQNGCTSFLRDKRCEIIETGKNKNKTMKHFDTN